MHDTIDPARPVPEPTTHSSVTTSPATGSGHSNVPARARRPWHDHSVALAIGPVAALAAAGLLAGVRDRFGSTNVALTIAMVVVVAAMASRGAGITTAIVGALAFNFFHTRPYRSLRIDTARDILTVVLLVVIGLAMSEISAWRRRTGHKAQRHLEGERALERTAGLLAAGTGPHELWATIAGWLDAEPWIGGCRFEAGPTTLPVIARSGAMHTQHMAMNSRGFDLPAGGIAVPVLSCGTILGHIVLMPTAGSGSLREERRVIVALADGLAVALARTSEGGSSAAALLDRHAGPDPVRDASFDSSHDVPAPAGTSIPQEMK